MKKRPSYLKAVVESLAGMWRGLMLSGKHMRKGFDRAAPLNIADPRYFEKDQGPITIQYPKEKVVVPDNGRYRLFMETDDCIGCDKCARICPVDCITIETFRADGDLGRTSDGTMKRLHLPTFDIDMAKCMYCGLCTTVCPTECLTMTPVYDYSEYDRDNFLYHFGAYSPADEARIRVATEQALADKKAAKSTGVSTQGEADTTGQEPTVVRPRPRPIAKPLDAPATTPVVETTTPDIPTEAPAAKPRPRPMMRPKEESETIDSPETEAKADSPESPATAEITPPRPRPRPIMKPKEETENRQTEAPVAPEPPAQVTPPKDAPTTPKARPRPIMKPPVTENPALEAPTSDDEKGGDTQ